MHLVNLKRRLYVIMPAVIPSIGNIKKQKNGIASLLRQKMHG